MNPYRILITGGHLSPAVGVIHECIRRKITSIQFVGRRYAFSQARDAESLEYQTVTAMDIPFTHLSAPRFSSGELIGMILYGVRLIPAVGRAIILVARLKPDVVITFGGYISVPVALASYVLRVPFIIHEQTTYPGRANILLSRLATHICVSWKETIDMFPSVRNAVMLTGNPVRLAYLPACASRDEGNRHNVFTKYSRLPLVFVTGGSTGAHRINRIVADGLSLLLQKYRIVHQCGDSHYRDYEYIRDCVDALPTSLKERYCVSKYLDGKDMSATMRSAAIIVGRAGANTVIEVARAGKPMVCIPLPEAFGDEQMRNARKLASYGSALILKQEDASAESLLKTLQIITHSYQSYVQHASAASKAPEFTLHQTAAHRIVDVIYRDIRDRRELRGNI